MVAAVFEAHRERPEEPVSPELQTKLERLQTKKDALDERRPQLMSEVEEQGRTYAAERFNDRRTPGGT